MNKKLAIPLGTRDLVLNESLTKRHLQNIIENVMNLWGYNEVITPTIEYYETFNPGFKYLDEEDMYKFFDEKGRILVLRPDMTLPISRLLATRFKEVETPIRFRYNANIFHANHGLAGRRNEFSDCGIELIGSKGISGDIETLVVALETMKTIKDIDFKLEIGNVNIIKSVFKNLELSLEQEKKLLSLINKKSIKELNDYLTDLNLEDKYYEFFNELPWLFGNKEVLEKAKKYNFNQEFLDTIDYLYEIDEQLCNLGYADYLSYDLGLVHRLSYYSGLIFRGYAQGIGKTILSGGRYDELLNIYDMNTAAIGFAIKVDVLSEVIKINESVFNTIKIEYPKSMLIDAISEAKKLVADNKRVELIEDNTIDKIEIRGV